MIVVLIKTWNVYILIGKSFVVFDNEDGDIDSAFFTFLNVGKEMTRMEPTRRFKVCWELDAYGEDNVGNNKWPFEFCSRARLSVIQGPTGPKTDTKVS